MNEHLGRPVAVVRLVAVLAAAASLGSCAGGMPTRAGPEIPAAALAPAPVSVAPAPAIGAVPKSKPRKLAAAAARRADVRRPAAGSLPWPVQGRILRAYGERPDGGRNDGLDIAATAGAVVRAVEDGIVRYAGSDLAGYGNMLLVAHEGGLTSIYAHNAALLVAAGAIVRRGQPIATVGGSGTVTEAQLHFQLRAGNRPVDPEPLLEAPVTVLAGLAPAGPTPFGAR